MKKMYEEPQLEVERFTFEDICDGSANIGLGGDGNEEDRWGDL